MRELFEAEELAGRNISGRKNKMQVDPVRVNTIKIFVFEMYATPVDEQTVAWMNSSGTS